MAGSDVAIIMGSQSDWATMRHAAETLETLGIPHDRLIVSAHRTPERLYDFARGAKAKGYKVVIAGAGGAAHLPGMTASLTPLPVFGVPVESKALSGQDSLLSIVQMPGGIPVGTLAIGRAGNVPDARVSLGDEIIAGPIRSLALQAKSRDRYIDQIGANRSQGVSIDLQLARNAGRQIDDNHIGQTNQTMKDVQPFRLRIVQRDTLLVAVDAQEPKRLSIKEWRPPRARIVAAFGTLNLENFRSHVRE